MLLAAGCTTVAPAPKKEPPILVIRNATGRELKSVTLGTVPARSSEPRRIGTISPLLRNSASTIVRPSDAPPLPAVCELKWTDFDGRTISVKIELKEVLKNAEGTPSEALVFQIRPDSSVMVLLERNAP
jgi:hypothetical protein